VFYKTGIIRFWQRSENNTGKYVSKMNILKLWMINNITVDLMSTF